MKKVFGIVLGFLVIFTFNSCGEVDDLLNNDCAQAYKYTVEIKGIEADIIENGDPAEGPTNWSVIKYRCDGTKNVNTGTTTPVNGYIDLNFNYKFTLNNNYDRVVVEVSYRGVPSAPYTDSVELDYTDYFVDGELSVKPSFVIRVSGN